MMQHSLYACFWFSHVSSVCFSPNVSSLLMSLQLPIVASSMVSLYFLELTDVVQPAQVGFRCHDRELSMPYVDGGDELIPLLMLLSLAFAGPAASVTLLLSAPQLSDHRWCVCFVCHIRPEGVFVLCFRSWWLKV